MQLQVQSPPGVSTGSSSSSSSSAAPLRARGTGRASTIAGAAPHNRRGVLQAGGVALPLLLISPSRAADSPPASKPAFLEVDQLSTFERSDQKTAFKKKAEAVLREGLTGADAPACVRLALHDAGTYDQATKTGGFDGSILLNPSELERPENKSLTGVAGKLLSLKAQIDEDDKDGSGPISVADLIYLAGKVATQKRWYESKVSNRNIGQQGGEAIAKRFPNPWSVELGRVDRPDTGVNRVPPQDADVEEIRTWLLKLGNPNPEAKAGPFTPKAPFWERPGFVLWTAAADDPEAEAARFVAANPQAYEGVSRVYEKSRNSVTRTDYEVDFAVFYNKLCNLGAKLDSSAYLHRIPTIRIMG